MRKWLKSAILLRSPAMSSDTYTIFVRQVENTKVEFLCATGTTAFDAWVMDPTRQTRKELKRIVRQVTKWAPSKEGVV